MRTPALDRILGLAVLGACVACGASPAYDAKTPATVAVPSNEVMVVPADRVVDKCPCGAEGATANPAQAKSVQYVHVSEWQSPAAAKRAEAFVAEDPSRFKASTPAPGALTMHQPIPETRVYRMGRSGWRW